MYTDMFKTFSEQTEKTLAPVTKFNQLFAKNIEQLTELQLAAVRSYSDLGVEQLKAATEVRDVQSLTAFSSKQLQAMTHLSQQMINDSNKLNEIAQNFKTEVDALATENVKKATSVA